MDVLSQALTWVRLTGEAVFTGTLAPGQTRQVPTGPGRFYFIADGRCTLAIAGCDALTMGTGDLVLLPRGPAHQLTALADDPSTPPSVRYVEGLYRFEGNALPPVLAALPRRVHVAANGAMPDWLMALTHFLLEESSHGEPGSRLMVSRLIDLLVIRALRTWATVGDGRFGRLAGLTDERVGHALAAIHNAPLRRWTVAELAGAASMSRSAFAERFTSVVGESPLRYLARWRLHLAAEMLKTGNARISDVAQRVGYSSDAAFSRAFKACFGHRPGETRAA
ncbi:AraC family transcriptional regulator [Luteibacter sp. 621]|uniref:AraC family transcriptional regulator n=1 Tax=Luteibacter sp. 621 TaxID=3373916 RepID=UPI003D1DE24B